MPLLYEAISIMKYLLFIIHNSLRSENKIVGGMGFIK
jgi:hypothetical protein